MTRSANLQELLFYAAPTHECTYLPGRQETIIVADPNVPKNTLLYSALCANGFRRSGSMIYRPHCSHCSDCIPIRIAAARFQPRRIQKRIWARNQDLEVRPHSATLREEDFSLYHRYLHGRHLGGGMDNHGPDDFIGFLSSSWSDTTFHHFMLQDKLVAVLVLDRLLDGLSAVYTFFDPEFSKRSLGVFTVLWALAEVERLDLPWLYLGYWIADSPKMAYKIGYQPQEHFHNGVWISCGKAKGGCFNSSSP